MDKDSIKRVIQAALTKLDEDNTVGCRTLLLHAARLVDEYNDEAVQELDSCNKTSDSEETVV
jgi:hypothetical protein